MKTYIKYVLLVITMIGLTNVIYGQSPCTTNDPDPNGGTPDQQALDTYWHYRYRLLHYFMVPGSKQGMSIPGDNRNASGNSMGWTDEGRLLGWYLATLATEYKLLKTNGENTDETVKELYYALHAVFRLDSDYVTNWTGSFDGNVYNSFPVTFPGYGIMGLGDVTASTLSLSALNTGLNPSGTSVVGSGQVAYLSSINGDGNGPTDLTVTSKDNFMGTLFGLAFVVKLVDPSVIGFSGCPNPYGYNLGPHDMALQLGQHIMNYIFNVSSLLLLTPDGKRASTAPGTSHSDMSYYFMWPFSEPLRDLSSNIFNYPVSMPAIPGEIILLPAEGGSQVFEALLIDPEIIWKNYDKCNAAQDFVASYLKGVGSLFSYISGEVTQITSGKSNDVIVGIGGCDLTGLELGEYAAATGNDGGAYDTRSIITGDITHNGVCDLINDYGNFNTGCSCFGGNTVGVGWDVYWSAVNDVLYGTCTPDMCSMQNIVYSAPYDGPFCHVPNSDYASCGWGGSRRFNNPASYGLEGSPFTGNYNGLDYMLLFNMYYLLSNSNPVTIPSEFSTIWPNPFPGVGGGIGDLSNPYTISSCNPFIISQLQVFPPGVVTTEAGDLILQGGVNGIDLIPSSANSIDIWPGGYFDAYCPNNCCYANVVNYISQPDPGISKDASPVLPPYQKTLEFDTLYGQNGIMNYPNPFKDQTTIEFRINNSSSVNIYVTDVTGRKVTDIVKNEAYLKGSYTIQYDFNELASGTYFCVFETNSGRQTVKMVKAK